MNEWVSCFRRTYCASAAAMLAISIMLLAWAADNAESSTAWLRNAGYSMVPERTQHDVLENPLGPQVNLVFYDDITERELRSLVLAVGAVVVTVERFNIVRKTSC